MPSITEAPSPHDSRAWRGFLLLAALLLVAGLGLRDPWPSDEPRFALVAKQMVESGQWLFPHRGIELYSDKPPLLFWMQASIYELFRNWRIAFLLPSLLASLGTLVLVYDLGKRMWNPRAGLYAAIGVLLAFQFMYQGKRAQIDPLVTFWITLANWGLLRHLLLGPDWRAFWIGCFAAGLGVVSKGVGILALLMLLPYAYAAWRRWNGLASIRHSLGRWLLGALAFVAPILAWAIPVLLIAQSRGGEYQAYVDDLFLRQTAGRYAKSWDHAQPFWYFVPVILLSWLPLSLAWPAAIRRWREDFARRDARVLLPLAWSALIVLFFSIPSGKRDVYVMPALPMVALAMAPTLESLADSLRMRRFAFLLAVLGGLAFVVLGAWAWFAHPRVAEEFLVRRELAGQGAAVWAMVLAIGAGFLVAAAIFRIRRGVHALLAGLAAMWLVWSLWAYPLLNDSSSAAGVMRRARALAGPDAEIGLVAWKEQNLLMLEGPKRDFGFQRPWHEQLVEGVGWVHEAPGKRWLFVLREAAEAVGACVDRAAAHVAGTANRRDWLLLPATALKAGCEPSAAENPSDFDPDS